MAARSAIVPQTQLSSSRLKHETSVQIISVPCSDIRWDSSCKRALTCQLAVVYCLLKRFRRPHHQNVAEQCRPIPEKTSGRPALSLSRRWWIYNDVLYAACPSSGRLSQERHLFFLVSQTKSFIDSNSLGFLVCAAPVAKKNSSTNRSFPPSYGIFVDPATDTKRPSIRLFPFAINWTTVGDWEWHASPIPDDMSSLWLRHVSPFFSTTVVATVDGKKERHFFLEAIENHNTNLPNHFTNIIVDIKKNGHDNTCASSSSSSPLRQVPPLFLFS